VKPIPETASKINGQIQALARACPKLRLVWTGPRAKKAVIVSGGGQPEGVRWVVRRWVESEDPVVKEGEDVYGP
jgi:hypothetical protein